LARSILVSQQLTAVLIECPLDWGGIGGESSVP
jgi:hypothetical protein